MVEHHGRILPALIFVSLLLGNLTSRLLTRTNTITTTIVLGSSTSSKNDGSGIDIKDDERRFYDLSSFNADEKRTMVHMAYILSVNSDTINWSELNRNNIEHNVESISVTVHSHKRRRRRRRGRQRSDKSDIAMTDTDDILPSSLITSSVKLLPTEQSSHLRTSLRRQMNHHRQLQDATTTPTTVPVVVVDGATTSAPSSLVVETTRPPRRTRRPRPARPARIPTTTAPATGSGTVVPGTTSPPVIGTVIPGTTTTPPVSVGTGAPGTSPPVTTAGTLSPGQTTTTTATTTTTTAAPTNTGTISTQEGDDGLENSGTDEVITSNNNEVNKGEITEVIEEVLQQWEDVTDDRFVTNPNTNTVIDDDDENENGNDDEKVDDDETIAETDDDDDDEEEEEEEEEKDEINDDEENNNNEGGSSSSSSNNKVDGDVFDGYEYKKGSNCQQSADSGGVPCAPTNLQELCNKYDRSNGSFRECLNACKPAFCKYRLLLFLLLHNCIYGCLFYVFTHMHSNQHSFVPRPIHLSCKLLIGCIHDADPQLNYLAPSCNTDANCPAYAYCYIVWWKLHDTVGPGLFLRVEQDDEFFDVASAEFTEGTESISEMQEEVDPFLSQLLLHHFDDIDKVIADGRVGDKFDADTIFMNETYWKYPVADKASLDTFDEINDDENDENVDEDVNEDVDEEINEGVDENVDEVIEEIDDGETHTEMEDDEQDEINAESSEVVSSAISTLMSMVT